MIFVTVSNSNYFKGTYALLNSLLRSGGVEVQFNVLLTGQFTPEQRADLNSLCSVNYIDVNDLGRFSVGGKVKTQRFIPSMQKLLLFKAMGGRVAYVDSDIVCVNNISEIEKMGHFSVAPDIGRRIQPATCARPQFNCGFFVFENVTWYDELVEYALNFQGELSLGDQTLLNRFMWERKPDEVKILDYRWNMLHRLKESFRSAWRPEEAKFIHFVGKEKPWKGINDRDFLKIWDKYGIY